MTDVRSVWLLVGSAGATGAVSDFFCALRSVLPVAFLYAQHFDPQRQMQLQDLSLRNSDYQLSLIEARHTLQPGRVLMVPPRHRIRFDADAVERGAGGWQGLHAPDFNQLLSDFGAAPFASRGLIVFSGMGEDGTASLAGLSSAGVTIWAQSPDTAVCGALPAAALATGQVDGDASPRQLALMLQQLYRH